MKKLIFIFSSLFLLSGCSNEQAATTSTPTAYTPPPITNTTPTPTGGSYYSDSSDDNEEVADEKDYSEVDGSQTVEACNDRTGDCYDLDAEISGGQVEKINFPNGGHLDLDGAELDENGQASGESYTDSEGYDGDTWSIDCSDCE